MVGLVDWGHRKEWVSFKYRKEFSPKVVPPHLEQPIEWTALSKKTWQGGFVIHS